jgi:hypothetical protein
MSKLTAVMWQDMGASLANRNGLPNRHIQNHAEEWIEALREEVELLDARVVRIKELEEYEEKYAAILKRCRETPGPCWCGVHVSDVMEKK